MRVLKAFTHSRVCSLLTLLTESFFRDSTDIGSNSAFSPRRRICSFGRWFDFRFAVKLGFWIRHFTFADGFEISLLAGA